MVTEYGMSARLGAVRYGRDHGDPFLGRSMGNQADYSLEVAHEIDEEVRALIEAAHTEAWEILNTYRDVLDDLVFELLEKETLTRSDLQRIFDRVEKRPRITAFNDFGGRTPSDKPPIQTPAERARERGEPWPPRHRARARADARRLLPGWRRHAGAHAGSQRGPVPAPGPPDGYPGGSRAAAVPGRRRPPVTGSRPGPQQGWGRSGPGAAAQSRGAPARASPTAVPPNYGAPADWRPATTPHGQPWPPAGQWQQPQWPQQPAPPAAGQRPRRRACSTAPEPPRENGKGPDEDGSR